MDSRFNLVKWFAWSGFGATIAVSLVSGSYFSRTLAANVLEHDAHVMTEFVNSIIRQDTGTDSPVSVIGDGETRRLAVFFNQLSKVPGIIRANVYSTDHEILWSSHEALINRQFEDNEELSQALSGQPVAHVSDVEHTDKDEHIMLPGAGSGFVEYYLPIWRSEDVRNEVVAVAEVYRVPEALFEQLTRIRISVWAATSISGLILFLSLFWIIYRAAGIIATQDARLMTAQRLATIGEMASTIAHGLRNPLSSIRSSAELARENANSPDTNRALEEIMLETDNMNAWVRRYLSHVEAEPVQAEICTLTQIIEQAISWVSSHPLSRDVEYQRQLPEQDVNLSFNELTLVQIISGLFSNALEARPRDRKIQIRTIAGKDKEEIVLQIIDRGEGISKPDLEKVFDPFFTTKRNGLGIGLSLARQILLRNSGGISIDCSETAGTVVSVSLPVA